MDRLIALEGAFNFRDLGGYPTVDGRQTRWRRLFRSDTLSELSAEDLALLADLGVATVIDLRTPAEVERDGRVAADVHYVNHSLLRQESGESVGAPEHDDMGERYLWYLEHNPEAVVVSLELLAREERYPAVFHCTAGKDRTGVLAALVLSLLGVPPSVVVADYVITAERLPLIMARLAEHPVYGPRVGQLPASRYGVVAESMEGFLSGLDARYGGAVGWAASVGLGDDFLDGLAARLLD
jgi:hypothetical protein